MLLSMMASKYCGETSQNSTPETWSHSNTMRASGARALGGMFCNARVTHTAKLCTKNTGAKKQQCWDKKKLCWKCWGKKTTASPEIPDKIGKHNLQTALQ